MSEKRGLERETGRMGKVNGMPMAQDAKKGQFLKLNKDEMNNRSPC